MTSIQKGGKEGYEYPKLEGDLTNFVDREGWGKIQTICGLPTWKALVGQDKHTDGAAIECAQGPDTRTDADGMEVDRSDERHES